jgi:FKBP-type peptidyl-prolyl cis-trans isomerase
MLTKSCLTVRTVKRFSVLSALAVVAACNLDTTGPTGVSSDPATETFASSLGIDIATMTKTTDGVYYKDLTVGTGPVLTGVPTISFTYRGFLKDGTVFDPGGAVSLALGGLLFGFQEGVQGMQVGGERIIVIPSALGYGSSPPANSVIPVNATLIFDVTLTQIN